MKKKEAKLRQQKVCQEVNKRETNTKSKRMTLYKGTLIDENEGDDEPQIELAMILLNLKFAKDMSFGIEALIDPRASHNFISFEAWKSLPQGSMVPMNATVRANNGTQTKPIGHVTVDVVVAKIVLHVHFHVMLTGLMEEHMVLRRTWCCLLNCQVDWHSRKAKMIYK